MRLPAFWLAALAATAAAAERLPAQAPAQPPSVIRTPGGSAAEVGGRTLNQWISDLRHPDPSVREEAIRSIILFGPEGARAVPQIVERLSDRDSSPRVKAAIALGVLPVADKDTHKVVEALGNLLQNDGQSIVRYHAAVTLNRFGEDARGAAGALAAHAADSASWEIRHACVTALRRAGRDPRGGPYPGVTRALLGALNDSTFQVRFEAIQAIGALGQPGDAALLAQVRRALEDKAQRSGDKVTVIWCYTALMALDRVDDKAVQVIVKYLRDRQHSEVRVRAHAARALGVMHVQSAVPALVAALDDKEPVVAMACWALGTIGEPGHEATAAVIGLLRSRDVAVRCDAAQGLGLMGRRGRPAVPALIEMLKDPEPAAITAACWALGEIADPESPAVAALAQLNTRKDVEDQLHLAAQAALDQIRKLKR